MIDNSALETLLARQACQIKFEIQNCIPSGRFVEISLARTADAHIFDVEGMPNNKVIVADGGGYTLVGGELFELANSGKVIRMTFPDSFICSGDDVFSMKEVQDV